MVSIRRRRYLGLCSGRSSLAVDLPNPIGNADSVELVKPGSVFPMSSDDMNLQTQEFKPESPEPSNQPTPDMPRKEPIQYYPGKEVKRRKRHTRKNYEDEERCIMRGVYYKNMKWQAAIKVDKKQIHLGTVASQHEAARLYDRAAFMCGRQPNFELSEKEKNELRQYNWDEFLAITRSAINNKKSERRIASSRRKKSDTQALSDWEQD